VLLKWVDLCEVGDEMQMLCFLLVCQYNIFYCRFLALCYVTVYSGRQVLFVFIFYPENGGILSL